ncbi:MAG: hypothetical protein ABMA00_00110 [Gemmatimonas sp.]
MIDCPPLITWNLKVNRSAENPTELKVEFCKPLPFEGHYAAEARLCSIYGERRVRVMGMDELQAFGCLFAPVRGIISNLQSEGFEIFHTKPGDLGNRQFWGFSLNVPKRRTKKSS